jgi:sugar lactone lactonase YvrE
MLEQKGRYSPTVPPLIAEGWMLKELTPPSRLFQACGLRTGADGRIYVAQVTGSEISAVDLNDGEISVVSPKGGDIVGPDDLAFDARGNLYATEVMEGRVSVLGRDGLTRVLRGDLPNANGITFHENRLFIDECRQGGRLLELDLNGGEPRVLLDNLPMPNALAPGPDGFLYFPLLGANEIWRVRPEGGAAERVASDLGVPDAVKFDTQGRIVSTQVHTGEVLRIDPRSGQRTVLARLDPGLDNLTFVGERLFVSHNTDGRITEILAGGETRTLVSAGFNWPLDLAVGDDGRLYVADGLAFYCLVPGAARERLGSLYDPRCPIGVRGLAPMAGRTFAVTTLTGTVGIYRPWAAQYQVLAEGLDAVYGVAIAPDGAIVVAEFGTGCLLSIRHGECSVLARGLRGPMGVAIAADGACFVSEAAAGRILKLKGATTEVVVDGLRCPHGISLRGSSLAVIDAGAQDLIVCDTETGVRRTIATQLPVGAPPGVTPKPLPGVRPICGPLNPYTGVRAAADGTLYVSGDAAGLVLALTPSAAANHPF